MASSDISTFGLVQGQGNFASTTIKYFGIGRPPVETKSLGTSVDTKSRGTKVPSPSCAYEYAPSRGTKVPSPSRAYEYAPKSVTWKTTSSPDFGRFRPLS